MTDLGLSSILSASVGYDFTKMSSKQLMSAASDLEHKGILTKEQAVTLMGKSDQLAYTPGYQMPQGSEWPFDLNTKHNFLELIRNNISTIESMGSAGGHDVGVQRSLDNDKTLLKILTQYQAHSQASEMTQSSGALLNQEA